MRCARETGRVCCPGHQGARLFLDEGRRLDLLLFLLAARRLEKLNWAVDGCLSWFHNDVLDRGVAGCASVLANTAESSQSRPLLVEQLPQHEQWRWLSRSRRLQGIVQLHKVRRCLVRLKSKTWKMRPFGSLCQHGVLRQLAKRCTGRH